jgi:hypothetical protein
MVIRMRPSTRMLLRTVSVQACGNRAASMARRERRQPSTTCSISAAVA